MNESKQFDSKNYYEMVKENLRERLNAVDFPNNNI